MVAGCGLAWPVFIRAKMLFLSSAPNCKHLLSHWSPTKYLINSVRFTRSYGECMVRLKSMFYISWRLSCWEQYLHFCHEGACNVDAHGIPIFTSICQFQLRLKGRDKHSPQNILIIFGREKVLTFDISGASRGVSGLQQFRLRSVQQTFSPFLGHLRLLCVCEPDHTSRTSNTSGYSIIYIMHPIRSVGSPPQTH